jgi:succinate-semialdehyde dehydrogenase/glutarate-semialdehyde dehydrogenase
MDPDTQLGPLTTQKRLNEVEALVEKTKQEGAKVLLGGKRPAGFNKGFFYEPTIFDDVKDDFHHNEGRTFWTFSSYVIF